MGANKKLKIRNTKYELLDSQYLADVDSDAALLRHKKSGARVVLLSNKDENKTFYIGFRTPPADSTGVAHIIEHSVLCGSGKYPCKDPFVELAKGSLNTFLNAMTFPDKTVYPVASCNAKDFRNLVDVYMDAVLHPNIYTNPKIFAQEGWHYELEDAEDELTINGVVYNEMKGVFSSPDDVLDRELHQLLFPDTAYGVESGGDPDVIPTLTYENFLRFHQSYYHPSNSYIYLYGDMDMEEYLTYLDEAYLSAYDQITVDSAIKDQADFPEGLRRFEKEYPVTEEEESQDQTFLSYAMAIGDNLDPTLYIAFNILDYALCAMPGAPVKKALLEKGICSDIDSGFDNSIKQSYYSITARDARYEDADAFYQTICDVLADQVGQGIDKKSLLAAINYIEFRYREADFGSTPRGLVYGLQMLDSWLYDDSKPFIHLKGSKELAFLKKQIDTDYFEKLIEEYILSSKRSVYLIMKPKAGLTDEKEKQLKESLAAYKASLSREEVLSICENTRALKEYQETPDSKETLSCIPLLKREDMEKKSRELFLEERMEDGIPVLYHEVFTNGIAYVRFLFEMDNLPERYYPYVGLLKAVLGYIDTEHFEYNDLNNEINIRTGGINAQITTFNQVKDKGKYRQFFEVSLKTFYDALPDAFMLCKEMILCSNYGDEKRLKEIISECKSRLQMNLMENGVSVAIGRALSYFSESNLASEYQDGLYFYQFIEDVEAHFEEKKDELVQGLRDVAAMLFRPENLILDITTEKKGYELVPYILSSFVSELYAQPVETGKMTSKPENLKEGLYTAGKVQYVCMAGNILDEDHPYTGALHVLKNLLSYGYLWTNIRVKGGAYGAFSSFSRGGEAYLVSYRDPGLTKTLEIYRALPDYLEQIELDEDELTKAIIGTIASIDMPDTPKSKGKKALAYYMAGLTMEDRQKSRDEILNVSQEDIRALGGYIRKLTEADNICVVGGESEVKGAKDCFKSVRKLT